MVATVLTYPMQLAQNRLRASSYAKKKGGVNQEGEGADTTLGCLLHVMRNEGGVKGLYKGIESKMLQTARCSVMNHGFCRVRVSLTCDSGCQTARCSVMNGTLAAPLWYSVVGCTT
jgi:hypothetical protein